jgi:hypothetical protein
MAKAKIETPPAETISPAISPALPLVDDETLDTFLGEPAKVARLPVPPTEYRREFQRMIVSAFLQEQAAA